MRVMLIFWLLTGCQTEPVEPSEPQPVAIDEPAPSTEPTQSESSDAKPDLEPWVAEHLSLTTRSDSHADPYQSGTICKRLGVDWNCYQYSSHHGFHEDEANIQWTVLSDTDWTRVMEGEAVQDLFSVTKQPNPKNQITERGTSRYFSVSGDNWAFRFKLDEVPESLGALVKDLQRRSVELEMQSLRYQLPLSRGRVRMNELAWLDGQYALKVTRCDRFPRLELWKAKKSVGYLDIKNPKEIDAWEIEGLRIQVLGTYCGRQNYVSVDVSMP